MFQIINHSSTGSLGCDILIHSNRGHREQKKYYSRTLDRVYSTRCKSRVNHESHSSLRTINTCEGFFLILIDVAVVWCFLWIVCRLCTYCMRRVKQKNT